VRNDLDRISFTESPQGVYKSLSQYKRVRANIIRSLARCKKNNGKGDSFIFDRLKVHFSSKYNAEEIWLDHVNGHIVLEAPLEKGETKESLRARRMEYHGQLLRHIEVMTSIGITTVYLLLDDQGRKEVEKTKAKTRKKKPSSKR